MIKTDAKKIKLTFKLTEEQAGNDPVSTETMFCTENNGLYKICNIPLLIDNISFEDWVSVKEIDDNVYQVDKVVQASKNSTVWLFTKDQDSGKDIIDKIVSLGCGVESGAIPNYYAVNVPSNVNIDKVYELIDIGEDKEILVADYPSIRH